MRGRVIQIYVTVRTVERSLAVYAAQDDGRKAV